MRGLETVRHGPTHLELSFAFLCQAGRVPDFICRVVPAVARRVEKQETVYVMIVRTSY